MIQTVQEYKDSRGLTWQQVAEDFGSKAYQQAQQWSANKWVVVTEPNGACRLMSPRRTLQRTLRNDPRA